MEWMSPERRRAELDAPPMGLAQSSAKPSARPWLLMVKRGVLERVEEAVAGERSELRCGATSKMWTLPVSANVATW